MKSGAIESGSFFSPTPSSIKYQVSKMNVVMGVPLLERCVGVCAELGARLPVIGADLTLSGVVFSDGALPLRSTRNKR